MISLLCTHCQAELTMDDAFAGGVCRCHYCGTIQTVPAASAGAAASKALYQKAATGDDASGLADLGQAMGPGSGLAGSGLGSARLSGPGRPGAGQAGVSPAPAAPPPPAATAREKKRLPVLAIAIVLGLLLLGGLAAGIYIWGRGRTAQTSLHGPTFATVPLKAASVIYLLDNGNSNDTLFDPLKAACYRSIESLGADRKFQVLLWDNGLNAVVFPPDGMHNATPQDLTACKHALADTVAAGNSHLAGPLRLALAQKPAALVIATGKWDLDRDDLAALASAGEAGVKLYTFGLGSAPDQGALKLAATATGGQYKHLTAGELNQASD